VPSSSPRVYVQSLSPPPDGLLLAHGEAREHGASAGAVGPWERGEGRVGRQHAKRVEAEEARGAGALCQPRKHARLPPRRDRRGREHGTVERRPEARAPAPGHHRGVRASRHLARLVPGPGAGPPWLRGGGYDHAGGAVARAARVMRCWAAVVMPMASSPAFISAGVLAVPVTTSNML
jgi:hypothetical protein